MSKVFMFDPASFDIENTTVDLIPFSQYEQTLLEELEDSVEEGVTIPRNSTVKLTAYSKDLKSTIQGSSFRDPCPITVKFEILTKVGQPDFEVVPGVIHISQIAGYAV